MHIKTGIPNQKYDSSKNQLNNTLYATSAIRSAKRKEEAI
jgi:hypothetical protein